MTRRAQPVYVLLIAFWCLVVVWQVVEHGWTKEAARTALINRSRDITRTLEAVIQSQRRFGGLLLLIHAGGFGDSPLVSRARCGYRAR